MEPQIRYARSADGTNIAYSILGEGRPLVFVGLPSTLLTIESDWRIPRVRRAIEQLAERRVFVRTDARGRGLSDDDVTDRSLDAHVADLRCVVDALSGGPVDLMASEAAVVCAFAAGHPERVRKAVISFTLSRRRRLSPRYAQRFRESHAQCSARRLGGSEACR
jgi:pimeloyl-ACP methyl ester carboxylesterase